MKVISLNENHEDLYLCCLEDWSDEMKEQGCHRRCWYDKMKDRGLGVKIAVDDSGTAGGMIQYIPVEDSPASGKNLFFIICIWVHGYKQGRGNFRKQGMGKALLAAAEEDVKNRGADGIAAWGLSMPIWMKASWFRKHGYVPVDKSGGRVLLLKSFNDRAVKPEWIKMVKKPEKVPGRVTVTAFVNGSCSVGGINYERAKRAAESFGEEVFFKGIDTSDRETFLEWGITDGIFIDDRMITTGPPPSFEKIRKIINREARRL